MTPPDASTRHDGRRILLDAGLGGSLVLATLTGPVARYFAVDFMFEPNSTTRDDYVTGGVATLATAALLVVGIPVLLRFRAAPWPYLVAAVGILLNLGLAIDCFARAGAAPRDDFPADYSVTESAVAVLWIPTSWPLLLFVLVALVKLLTTPLSPGPRAPQDR